MNNFSQSSFELAKLRMSLRTKIKNAANKADVPTADMRKCFIFSIFYKHLFAAPNDWMVLGGNALVVRTGGGRFTEDVDLSRAEAWENTELLKEELQKLIDAGSGLTPFVFTVIKVDAHSETDTYGYGAETAKANVVAELGDNEFESFSIDLTSRRHTQLQPEVIKVREPFTHELLENLPAIPVVAIETHIADKVCALYQDYGGATGRSTRYRDLADLVRIVQNLEFEAEKLVKLLPHEAQRRKMDLPSGMESPHSSWEEIFPDEARDFAQYPAGYTELDAALNFVGRCLNQVLDGSRGEGKWNPYRQRWV